MIILCEPNQNRVTVIVRDPAFFLFFEADPNWGRENSIILCKPDQNRVLVIGRDPVFLKPI